MGMPKLKSIADKAITSLQEGVNNADNIRDDLSFLIEKANGAADKLEGRIKANRTPAAPKVSNLDASNSYASSELKEEFVIEEKKEVIPEERNLKEVTDNMTENFFEEEKPSFGGDDDRSEAELELLKALRSMK